MYDLVDCAEFLWDVGAKLRKDIDIPEWLTDIIFKRQRARQSARVFAGIMRRRIIVEGAGTEHIGNRLPKDVVKLLSVCLWKTRFRPNWRGK